MSVARMLLDDGASATKVCDATDAAKSAAGKVWPIIAANALFLESDCTGPCGKVAQPTTSIGEVAYLVSTTKDRAIGTCCLSEGDFLCLVVGPGLCP